MDVWPENLVELVQVLDTPIQKPDKPEFAFEMTTEAAERNYLLLMQKYKSSLELALKSQQHSSLGIGSEFRPIKVLQAIYGSHPTWNWMVPVLRDGSLWPLEPISKELRSTDVHEAIEFGNHQGAQENPSLLTKLVTKDVKHSYALAFPFLKALSIPGILMAPINIMHQDTINETGRVVEKKQLTHNQSYEFGLGTTREH
jgi:hypothetical protein